MSSGANTGNNINFSFEYAVSIVVVLLVCNSLVKSNPAMNTMVVIIAGLVAGGCSLYVMNNFFPHINSLASSLYQYFAYQTMDNYNSMEYTQIWPPILAVLLIFVILLYNKNLG
jgi:hypothetical protein